VRLPVLAAPSTPPSLFDKPEARPAVSPNGLPNGLAFPVITLYMPSVRYSCRLSSRVSAKPLPTLSAHIPRTDMPA